jgi:hypothetical protein
MPIDISMYSTPPVRSVLDYQNDYLKNDLGRQTLQANALAFQQAQQANARQMAVQNLLQQGLDPNNPAHQQQIMAAGGPEAIKFLDTFAQTKQRLSQSKVEDITADEKKYNLGISKINQAHKEITSASSPLDIVDIISRYRKQGDLPDDVAMTLLNGLGQAAQKGPEGIKQYQDRVGQWLIAEKDKRELDRQNRQLAAENANRPLVQDSSGNWVINQKWVTAKQLTTPPQALATDQGVITVQPYSGAARPAYWESAGQPPPAAGGTPPPSPQVAADQAAFNARPEAQSAIVGNARTPSSIEEQIRIISGEIPKMNPDEQQAALREISRLRAQREQLGTAPSAPTMGAPAQAAPPTSSLAAGRYPQALPGAVGPKPVAVEPMQMVDPEDATKLIWVNRNLLSTKDRSQYYLGDVGKTPEALAKQTQAQAGLDSALNIINRLKSAYTVLQGSKGITDPNQTTLENSLAFVRSSAPGQLAGSIIGSPEQSARNLINAERPLVLGQIKSAFGTGTREMDSNADMKRWMSTLGDPTKDIKSTLEALNGFEEALRKRAQTKENLDAEAARQRGKSTSGTSEATPATTRYSVTTPDGNTHTFPTPEALAAFKKAAGL